MKKGKDENPRPPEAGCRPQDAEQPFRLARPVYAGVRRAAFTHQRSSDILSAERVTTAIHPNVVAGEAPTLSPFAPASPDGLGRRAAGLGSKKSLALGGETVSIRASQL